MIKISNLVKTFGDQVLFEGLSFSLNRRERVGLVGRNGHGKTTLFNIILGQVSSDGGEITRPKRYTVGHLEQHLHFTQDTALDEACLGLPADRAGERWKVEKALAGLGFTEGDMQKPPGVFSGGYQVRLNLAKVLVSEPDLLLLDEPTNYLDVVSIRWLSRYLQAWRSELMMITHDRSFMDSVTTHTVGIHRRRAKKIEGSTDKLYTQILQEEEIHEKTRINDEKKRKEVERFVERFRAKNTLATRVQSRIKMLGRQSRMEKLDRIATLDFSFNSESFPAKTMMSVQDVSFGYDGGPPLFEDFNLEVHRHDRICVMGQNGKGKTTLLRLMAGELEAQRGRITRHPKLDVGYFGQTNRITLNPNATVVEEIQHSHASCLPQTARNIAGALMFEGDRALKKVSVLSGGERSRVMLAQLLVTPAHLLLLDEPTNHLDQDSCDSLLAAIDAFDGAVVIVTHNEMFLHSLANRFVVFDRGNVTNFERSYRSFLDDVGWEMDDLLRAKPRKESMSATDKKAQRQNRARIQQERSKALKPLQDQIERLENKITSLEKDSEAAMHALSDASSSGDHERIAELSKKNASLTTEIETQYRRLEEVTAQHETRSQEFERRLNNSPESS